NIGDICRKLEEIVAKCASIGELFARHAIDLRIRLKEHSETLLFKDPQNYGRKSEELFWRRNYHDFMLCYKRFKKDVTSEEVVLLETHFISGIGHYDSAIRKFAAEFGLDLSNVLLEVDNHFNHSEEEERVDTSLYSEREVEAAKLCIHRMFICLGDIFRYLDELGFSSNHVMAIKWYNIAISYNPSIGMPYNQLGTLSGGCNHGLDAAYYYMRCALTEKPFDGAESNLIHLLNATTKGVKETRDSNHESVNLVKQAISRFLLVANDLWNHSFGGQNLISNIHDCFVSLKQAIELPVKLSTPNKPTFLDTSSLFKIGVSILMLISKLERNGVVSGPMHSAAIAFALNFLFLIIASCTQKIREKFEKGSDLSKPAQTIINGNTKLSSNSQFASKENTPELSPRRTLSRLRRRKAAIKYDDIDITCFDFDDDDSELSELEETALSTIDALEISSDISESGSVCDENDFKNHLNSSDDDSQGATRSNTESYAEVEGILQYVYYETSLAIVKVYCDWLRFNQPLMTFCVKTFPNLFSNFADLLNILLAVEAKSILSNKRLQELKYTDLNWEQKYPLTVDHALRKFPLLDKLHSKFIDFSSKRQLNGDEMGFLCIENLLSFGHFVINNVNKCTLKFDSFTKRFMVTGERNGSVNNVCPTFFQETTANGLSDSEPYLSPNGDCLSPNPKNGVNIQIANNSLNNSLSPDYASNDLNKQKQMMRNMAHLWLKSEVSKLEKTVKGGRILQLSPYVVIDSSAYFDHLNLVKDLVFAKRFIVVVPKITHLDQKKKVSANAREAIRWLESEAQRGNRFLKFQRENERFSLAPIKYPRRKDKDSYNFFILLEYCNFLHQLNSSQINNKNEEVAMVTLLFSSSNTFPTNADALVKSVGISMENIELFVSKWRASVKAKT
ncbi:protein SMG5-like protein, partial [Dinothrombium tinctorium]